MSEYRQNKRMDNTARVIALLLCSLIFMSTFYVYGYSIMSNDEPVTALADTNDKHVKWEKKAVDEGTTIDATYLWPNEENASFTAIYRNGEQLSDEKMVTITKGSVYHFRGTSDKSILYTEVYVGNVLDSDTSNESTIWFKLLPLYIRNSYEADCWTWENGWKYTGRAYLDSENKRIMLKDNDDTAVLYGMGLYLDYKYNYSEHEAFINEGEHFKDIFGDTDNQFASAFEYYYTMGGKLSSTCPEIYNMISDMLLDMENRTLIPINTSNTVNESNPTLNKELLEYVNIQRKQAGLNSVTWDSDNDDNIITRVEEVCDFPSQTRPNGTEAFTAYTDTVMCEMRLTDANTEKVIFDCAAGYFLMDDLKTFNCASNNNNTVLIFTW